MASIDDEKLVLHVRERFVVLDLLKEALLRIGGQSLDCVGPGFQRRGVESIRVEGVIFCCRRHQLWRKGAIIEAVPSPCGKGKQTGGSLQARVWVICMLNSTTHFICHAGCVNGRQANGLPRPSWHYGYNHVQVFSILMLFQIQITRPWN